MRRRAFIRNMSLAGTAITLPTLTGGCSGLQDDKSLPSVYFTQQDFISTFPWGIRGDKVRILQQEVENELLDAETLVAYASMLGLKDASSRLDEAWKLMLNSQNHDVHVVLADEAGIEWCNEARILVREIRENAINYLTSRIGGSNIAFNTLPWTRKSGQERVPGFGYAVLKDENNADEKNLPWNDWFDAGAYKIRMLADGSLETQIGSDPQSKAILGYLTVFNEGKMFDSRTESKKITTWRSEDGTKAYAEITGEIIGIPYAHKIVANDHYIDFETTFDYGDGHTFGPEPADSQAWPRRTHYWQHERKMCMNCDLPGSKTRLLKNSPFLTWPHNGSKSAESVNFVVLESAKGSIAHFNIGQAGYGYNEKNSSLQHVVTYSPTRFVYGRGKQLLKGKESHSNRFMPFTGDWRNAKVSVLTSEYKRPLIDGKSDKNQPELPAKGSFLQIASNTTTATSLFERGGKFYVRLWEWAGQKDTVTLQFGDENSSFIDSTHGLKEIGKLDRSFDMRPWEVKTVELVGTPIIMGDINKCSTAEILNNEPEGWSRKNYFEIEVPKKSSPRSIPDDAPIYFATGYHDGLIRPIKQHTPTMGIEMERVRSPKYPNYTSTWEIGGSCWALMKENEPEYIEILKPYVREGSIEIVGGTWCEPLCLTITGESVIRQFLYGMEATEGILDTKVTVYSNQEHGTFAQMPQILRSFGIKAVVNRTQWAPFGYESGIDADVAEWVGLEGSTVYVIPRYNSMDYLANGMNLGGSKDSELAHGSVTGHNRVWRTEVKFKELRDNAMHRGIRRPFMTMLEDIWSEGLRSSDEEMDFYASLPYVKFISIARYLAMFGIKV